MPRNLRLRVGQDVLPAPAHRLNGCGTQAQCQRKRPNNFLTERKAKPEQPSGLRSALAVGSAVTHSPEVCF